MTNIIVRVPGVKTGKGEDVQKAGSRRPSSTKFRKFLLAPFLRDWVDGEVAPVRQERSAEEWTEALTGLALAW